MFSQTLCRSVKLKNFAGCLNEFNQLVIHRIQLYKNEQSRFRLQPWASSFCTYQNPKNTNIFGDISGRKFEHFEMDELEKKEEEFQDTEKSLPRWMKYSSGQYEKMIKSHLSRNDLKAAVTVLDLIKEKRDKPTMYIYNLLLQAFAKQGDIKQCFRLYNKAKQRKLEPNAATYTSLFNACAMSDDHELALEHLNRLRQSLYQQKFPLNTTHYNVMIKAYSWLGKVAEAFALADEMKDKRIFIGESTYNSLLHAAITDKEAGLRYGLIVWHLMRLRKTKPTLVTYNLFLRTVRDTDLGSLMINSALVANSDKTKIVLKEGERPDLLASPPVLSTLLPLVNKKENSVQRVEQNVSLTDSVNLNDILVNNRLLLFGGLEGLMDRMANDGVKPDIKTITILLNLIPNSVVIENLLVEIAEKNDIKLDIDFYNMLIKKRNMRNDFKAAKEVVGMAEKKGLSPNVMTFGVLALGCKNYADGKTFLSGLEAFDYRPNAIIMGTLIQQACHSKDFEYLMFVMKYMMYNKIRPNQQAINDLKEFSKNISKIEQPTGKYEFRKKKRLEKNIEMFEDQYPKWQRLIQDDE